MGYSPMPNTRDVDVHGWTTVKLSPSSHPGGGVYVHLLGAAQELRLLLPLANAKVMHRLLGETIEEVERQGAEAADG